MDPLSLGAGNEVNKEREFVFVDTLITESGNVGNMCIPLCSNTRGWDSLDFSRILTEMNIVLPFNTYPILLRLQHSISIQMRGHNAYVVATLLSILLPSVSKRGTTNSEHTQLP